MAFVFAAKQSRICEGKRELCQLLFVCFCLKLCDENKFMIGNCADSEVSSLLIMLPRETSHSLGWILKVVRKKERDVVWLSKFSLSNETKTSGM